MIPSSVARRYARALLSLGLEGGKFEQYGEEIEAVVRAMKDSRELGFLFTNPGYANPLGTSQAALENRSFGLGRLTTAEIGDPCDAAVV